MRHSTMFSWPGTDPGVGLPETPTHAQANSLHAGFGAAAPLEKNGWALLDDLESPLVRSLASEMERYQFRFLARTHRWWTEAREGDRLGHWSRRWEYPYAAWNLLDRDTGRMLDAGAGLTFFPFSMAAGGWTVSATAPLPSLTDAFEQANVALGTRVRFDAAPLEALPYDDASFDAVACVGGLELAEDRDRTVQEFARVLATGGRLVLTLETGLSADAPFTLADAAALFETLERHFEPAHRTDLTRPASLLTTDRVREGEYWRLPSSCRGGAFRSLATLGSTWIRR